MEQKRKIEIAAELLRESFGYVGGKHSDGLSFDFSINEDGEGIEVFCANEGTFYWPEEITTIAAAVKLSCFISEYNGKVSIHIR